MAQDELPISDEAVADSGVYLLGQAELSKERGTALDSLHSSLRLQWLNGGVLARCYLFEYRPASNGTHFTTSDAIALLQEISAARLLPAEIAGCSIVYLQQGNIMEERAEDFSKALIAALTQGGAYGPGISPVEARELTERYLSALGGSLGEGVVKFFALEPGFSCWFERVAWDLAYLIVGAEEGLGILLLATDTD